MSEQEGNRLVQRLNLIKEKVFELKSSDRLPGLTHSDTGGELVIIPIDEALKNSKILTAEMREVVKPFKEAYMVSVDFKKRKMKYLFSAIGDRFQLLGSFEEKEGGWVEIGEFGKTKGNKSQQQTTNRNE